MTIATPQHSATDAPPPSPYEPPLAPITVSMYTEILRAGILEGVRAYLWEGRLAPRMTTGRPHTLSVLRTYHALYNLRLQGVFVEPEQPMTFRLSHSAPYPDVKLVRGRPEDFPRIIPTTADVPLVVEVADSSLYEDRRKVQAYAREGIPISWIINLNEQIIEVYRLTGSNTYGPPTRFGEDAEVPVVVDGTEVALLPVRDLLA